MARYHHEKYNGKGYPDGLAGEQIPLHARIMAIADVFDAVSQKRCYREAVPIDECFDAPDDYCAFWCAEAYSMSSVNPIYQIAAVKMAGIVLRNLSCVVP